MKAAERALKALRSRAGELPGEWPLTLHMLQGHAPQFFAEHDLRRELDAQLDAMTTWPLQLSGTADAAMDQADARWLLARHGRAVPPLTTAAHLDTLDSGLHRWLLAELLGLPPRSYTPESPVHEAYFHAHRVLLDTDWLHRAPSPAIADALAALERGLPKLWLPPNPDVLGEALFCLQRAGRDLESEVESYARFQRPDGSFDGDAHCTAVGLLVTAHR